MNVQDVRDTRFDMYFAADMRELVTELAAHLQTIGVTSEQATVILAWVAERYGLEVRP